MKAEYYDKLTIRDLIKDFSDSEENGAFAFGKRLIIRPPYQREFVYNEKQQQEVITTILENCPIGNIYWAETGEVDENGKKIYEVLDGQQRIISICRYFTGEFSWKNGKYYYNASEEDQKALFDRKIPIYIFVGTETEKLKWFERINIAGATLTPQELRNAAYHGTWVSSARSYFSKRDCAAVKTEYRDFISGTPNRQDILETVIEWKASAEGVKSINEYMGKHQHDKTAEPMWMYYQKVMNWAVSLFDPKKCKKLISNQAWGPLYEKYHDKDFTKTEIMKDVEDCIKDASNKDGTITKSSGIIEYVLAGKTKEAEKLLNIRAFDKDDILKKLLEQDCKCHKCGKEIDIDNAEGDHITPYSEGGKTEYSNLQVLCKTCNRTKSNK